MVSVQRKDQKDLCLLYHFLVIEYKWKICFRSFFPVHIHSFYLIFLVLKTVKIP